MKSMSKFGNVVTEIHHLDDLAGRTLWANKLDARIKILITVSYIAVLSGLGRYNISGAMWCALYVIAGFFISDLRFDQTLKRVWPVMLLVGIFGLPNVFLDRLRIGAFGNFVVTGGMVSFMVLFAKGVLAVLASYLLIATTTIEKICRALRQFHIPSVITTQLLLTYRYLGILIRQVEVSAEAYSLRAPGQSGVRFSAWGSMVGQILIQSIDRAHELYESMLLAGFDGEFYDE